MDEKIKLLIADDHPTYREGLCRLLDDEDDFECVGEAADGVEAINLTKKLNPDVILIDLNMPKLEGTKVAKEINKSCPDVAIIILSAFDYEASVITSLQAGVRGYLLKTTPLDKLTQSIRLVHRGESVLDTKATDKLLRYLQPEENGRTGENSGGMHFQRLYPRELQVLELAAKGKGNKEIADDLTISERTVQTHLVNIFKKLGVNSRTQAVIYGLKEGWVTIGEKPSTK